jgi:hypothetical protein
MTPEQLAALVTSLTRAAEIVEAIDDRALQQQRGWALSCWRYDLVSWGVRFTRKGSTTRAKCWWWRR